LQDGCGNGEQAVIGKRHEAAAMNVVGAIEMLLCHPERAADAAIVLHPVIERAVMRLEIVAAPGAPTPEFALGFDVQIGSVVECGFDQVVHAIGPSFEGFKSLNPIHTGCANPSRAQSYGQREIAP